VTEVHADQRHPGGAGQLGGAEQAAVTAEDDDELGAFGCPGAGRHPFRAGHAELGREGTDSDSGRGQPLRHQPGAAQRALPARVRHHQHHPLSH
jgi:hypothetical protein